MPQNYVAADSLLQINTCVVQLLDANLVAIIMVTLLRLGFMSSLVSNEDNNDDYDSLEFNGVDLTGSLALRK